MNEVTFETSWGAKLSFSPIVSKAVADTFEIESDEWQGFADMDFHSANGLAKKLGKRLPTSTELHELHLWLSKNSDWSWPTSANAYWSSTPSRLGGHYAVLLCNANCVCNSDERHCYVSYVSSESVPL
ncbi:hypothetical protein Shal_0695 [Shewanella halifaxensis HAW-EB4]|uniref:Uncharacterized protein n=1 Tax=Shewanella halifaxensis (strain HAW-EB4) TaxID=458817 RepID=B0TSU5_SHEHH|nr:hypothetical protein [Shewanella halifaxensis]ABZ75270.1 hypothetical protein Shal_0695 [Shewanella halifaxensis HAW-EB4]